MSDLLENQSDLQENRLIPDQPPFTSVGVDIFGPCDVITQIDSLQTALSTCLVTWAVHIEALEEMSSSSFINALRRFTVI